MNPQLAGSSPNTYKAPTAPTAPEPTTQNTSPYSQQPQTAQRSSTTGTTANTQTNTNNTGITNTNNTGITNTGSGGIGTTTPRTTGSNSSSGYQGGWSVPTVEDETAKLTGSDSITMQQARNEGLRTAASRGLLNSSISGQAAEQAAIAAAAPMAETNVANQLAQQQFAQGVTANTQGQYMTATQDILNQALISINEIETAAGIKQEEKNAMIANTIKRRDADLAFMQEYYSMMPTWSGNWVNFPTMPKAPGIG